MSMPLADVLQAYADFGRPNMDPNDGGVQFWVQNGNSKTDIYTGAAAFLGDPIWDAYARKAVDLLKAAPVYTPPATALVQLMDQHSAAVGQPSGTDIVAAIVAGRTGNTRPPITPIVEPGLTPTPPFTMPTQISSAFANMTGTQIAMLAAAAFFLLRR